MKKEPKPRSPIQDVNSSLSLRGSVRSSLALSGEGLAIIRSSAKALADNTKRAMQPGRNETFTDAIERLGMSEAELPLVHNQLMLQAMMVLGVALLALFAAVGYGLVQGRLGPTLIALIIAVTCACYAAQASFRAFSIRRRELGNWNAWLASPDEWIISRMGGCRDMNNSDPMVKPTALNDMAKTVRRRLLWAAGFFAAASLVYSLASANAISSGAAVFFLAALFQLIMSVRDSFTIYRGRHRRYYDLMAWVSSPGDWIPKVLSDKDATREERRHARRMHEERAAVRAAQMEAMHAHGGAADA